MKRRLASGMALIAILWLVAALSLVITGLLASVRTEARLTQHQQDAAIAAAWGDAAILRVIMAAGLTRQEEPRWIYPARWQTTWADTPIEVELRPASGWIDINRAPPELLADLFQYRGGLPSAAAAALAQRVVAERSLNLSGASARFDNPADLLRIPEFPVEVYATIKDLVTVHTDAASAGKVNPWAAPESVLRILAPDRPDVVARLLQAQSAALAQPPATPVMDATELNPSHTHTSPESTVRLTATVGAWQRIWWVRLGAGSGPLPWHTLEQSTQAAVPAR